jgi:hypothetical protein
MSAKLSSSALDGARILYSTNTWLAYKIAEDFYRQHHYVWCTPVFDAEQSRHRDSAVPPSSSPLAVYWSLLNDTKRADRHSSRIDLNKAGILRGAGVKRAAGFIDEDQEKRIQAIVRLSERTEFRPLLYVIPLGLVSKRLREPPPEDKAAPLSAEFIIDDLPRAHFDVIEFGGR